MRCQAARKASVGHVVAVVVVVVVADVEIIVTEVVAVQTVCGWAMVQQSLRHLLLLEPQMGVAAHQVAAEIAGHVAVHQAHEVDEGAECAGRREQMAQLNNLIVIVDGLVGVGKITALQLNDP